MKSRLVVAVMLACLTDVAYAQRQTLNGRDRLLDGTPRVSIAPGYTFVSGAPTERSLSARLRWPGHPSAGAYSIALLADAVFAGRDRYARSAVRLRHERPAGRISLSAAGAYGAGFGDGPSRTIAVSLSAGVPTLTVEFRSAWLQERAVSRAAGSELESRRPPDYAHTEGELHGSMHAGPFALRATAGIRFGESAGGPEQWLWGEAGRSLSDRLSLVASGGVRPYRPELAQRGGSFVLVGFRMDTGRSEVDPPIPPAPVAPPALVLALAPDRYRFELVLAGARSLELNGDVTDWDPVPMSRVPGRRDAWAIILERPAGIYHINIRVDRSEWIVPPGFVAVPDRFGGLAGLLTLQPIQGGDP